MGDPVTVDISTVGFDAMIDDLTDFANRPRAEVLVPEVARVLEICVKRSPGKSNATVRKKARLRVEKPSRYIGNAGSSLVPPHGKVPRSIMEKNLQTLTGTRGGTSGAQYLVQADRTGRRFFIRVQHGAPVKDVSQWNRNLLARLYGPQQAIFNEFEPKAIAAEKAVGSIKKSWVQIADAIGAELRIPDRSFIRKAESGYDDGARSRIVHEDALTFIEVFNTNSMLIGKYGGAQILAGAIQTREAAFIHELKHDVFSDLARRAKVHPGVFVG